jgi:hypothetical protein
MNKNNIHFSQTEYATQLKRRNLLSQQAWKGLKETGIFFKILLVILSVI